MKFRIRSLFVIVTCVAIAIPSTPLLVNYVRSLQPVQAVIPVKYSQVRAILPAVEQYSTTLRGVCAIKRDDRTNTIVVTSRERDCDANAKAISDFITQLEIDRSVVAIDAVDF